MAQIDQIIRWLTNEVNIWTAKGIITPAQKDQLLALYRKVPEPAPHQAQAQAPSVRAAQGIRGRINIARVILVLGVICIAVGLVIFYASNWRKMPPGMKLAQVFLLIAVCYAASWYLIFVKKELFTGRLILLLAMVTFGIGIMLVAQVYHISSHPTNGLLVWAIGTLIMSALMDDKWGCYMSMALFTIWDYWEVTEYGNPAYTFIVPVLIIGFLMYRKKAKAGMALTAVLLIAYWLQVNIHYMDSLKGESWVLFLYLFYALGPALMVAGRLLRFDTVLKPAGHIVSGTGWVFFIIPLLGLSWPYRIHDTKHLLLTGNGHEIIIAEFMLLLLAAAGGAYMLKKRSVNPAIFIPFIASAAILIMVPHYSTTARMVSTHLVLTGIIASSLAFAYTVEGEWRTERGMAFAVTIILFLAKWSGLTGSAFDDSGYKVAYLVGFIIFSTVVFLINRFVKHVSGGSAYPSLILDILTSLSIWITIYTASFKIENQKSIFTADIVVIVMIFLFIAMAVALYMYLMARLEDNRVIIYLSMTVFIASGVTLFIAGDSVSWIVYSLVFNLLLLTATGTWIYFSTVVQSRVLLNAAICAFLAHITTRYFDLFWDMLSGSVLFITTGVIGLAGGYLLERKRRQIIESFETGEAGHE